MHASSYHATGVDEICRRSGTTKGGFYYHFESKEALTLAVLEMQWEEFRLFLDACFDPALTPNERFAKYFADSVTFQKAEFERTGRVLGCPVFALGSEVGGGTDAISMKVRDILNETADYFHRTLLDMRNAEEIPADTDIEALAWAILVQSEGAMTLARIQNRTESLEHVAESVRKLLTFNDKTQDN